MTLTWDTTVNQIHVSKEDDLIEHIDSYLCPCNPRRTHRNIMTGKEVWWHKALCHGEGVH